MNISYLVLFNVDLGHTEFAAAAFSDYVQRGMDQGLLTGAMLIDLRKAFDCSVAMVTYSVLCHDNDTTMFTGDWADFLYHDCSNQLIKSGTSEPSKTISWMVLETVLSHLNPFQFCPFMSLLGFPVFHLSSSIVLSRYNYILVSSMTI